MKLVLEINLDGQDEPNYYVADVLSKFADEIELWERSLSEIDPMLADKDGRICGTAKVRP